MNAITNPTHAYALTTPILGHNNEIEYIQVIPKESPLSRPEHFKTHFEVTPGKWFESVYSDILTTPYLTYDSRINGNGVAPWRIPFSEIPRHAIKYVSSKLYMTPGVFKPMDQCFGKGMGHQDVLFVPVTAIDFDRPQGGIPASPEQVEFLARAVPGAALLKSNGVQMFLRSSGNWEVEAPMLAQIGRYLEKLLAPLFYDASCHLKRDGSPGNHRNHAYRCPWGACDSGPVRCWLPKNDQLATVRDVFNMLGLSLPPAKEDVEIVDLLASKEKQVAKATTSRKKEKATNPTHLRVPQVPPVSQAQSLRAGSFQPNHAEFEEIRLLLGDLLKRGVPREQATAQISAMSWEFHSRAHLEKTLPTVIPKGGGASDGLWLPADEWAKVVADLVDLVLSVGPSSLKRMLLQKTRTVRATRAWSFEFLYYFSLTLDEAIAGFFTWQPFEEIRDLSVSAIGRDAVIEDLRRCWERFNQNPGRYARNPYSNLPLVSQKTLSLVRQKAHALGNFKMADIKKELPSLCATTIRVALKSMPDEIIPSNEKKGRIYRAVKREVVGQGSAPDNPIVALKSKAPEPVPHAPPVPQVSGWVADHEKPTFPPREVYAGRELWKRENEIKGIFRLLPLRALKARWRKVVEICCDAPGNCPEQWERDWLKQIIDDLESEKMFAKKQAKKEKTRPSRDPYHAQTRYIEDIERKCLAAGEDFTDEDWRSMRDFMRVDFSRFADKEAQKRATEREAERQAGMLDYCQRRIDGGFDGSLGPGETLLDRALKFEAERREKREQARARKRAA